MGHASTIDSGELASLTAAATRVLDQLRRVVLGQDAALREALLALLSRGQCCWRDRRAPPRRSWCAR